MEERGARWLRRGTSDGRAYGPEYIRSARRTGWNSAGAILREFGIGCMAVCDRPPVRIPQPLRGRARLGFGYRRCRNLIPPCSVGMPVSPEPVREWDERLGLKPAAGSGLRLPQTQRFLPAPEFGWPWCRSCEPRARRAAACSDIVCHSRPGLPSRGQPAGSSTSPRFEPRALGGVGGRWKQSLGGLQRPSQARFRNECGCLR